MPVETDAERAVFVDPADFGTVATWTLQGGGTSALNILFDSPSVEVIGGEDVVVMGRELTALARSSDLPGTARAGDTLTVDGIAYEVTVISPDGLGMSTIRVARQD